MERVFRVSSEHEIECGEVFDMVEIIIVYHPMQGG